MKWLYCYQIDSEKRAYCQKKKYGKKEIITRLNTNHHDRVLLIMLNARRSHREHLQTAYSVQCNAMQSSVFCPFCVSPDSFGIFTTKNYLMWTVGIFLLTHQCRLLSWLPSQNRIILCRIRNNDNLLVGFVVSLFVRMCHG